MLIVALVIVALSILLGAEQGPKVDPTTTTYTPRPEWYFFFLFELLRVIKPPWATPIATIGIPTLAWCCCSVAAVLRPQPGAPTRAPADRDHRGNPDDHRDGLPDLPRRHRGAPEPDRPEDLGRARAGQGGRRPVGLPRLPQARRQRQRRPRARADRHRRAAAAGTRSPARCRSGPGIMPSYPACRRRSSRPSRHTSPRSTDHQPHVLRFASGHAGFGHVWLGNPDHLISNR